MCKTTAEKIAIMQAFLDGKKIEYVDIQFGGTWKLNPHPTWNWIEYDYRIKPVEQDSINWDHVHPDYNYMARDKDGSGTTYVFKECPVLGTSCWHSSMGYEHVGAIASYKRGETDWKDSLVVRPGYLVKMAC